MGVDEQSVGKDLDPFADLAHLAHVFLVVATPETHLEHLPRRVGRYEVAWRSLGHDFAAVHDDQPITELLGLIHVMGREDECRPALLQLVQPVPEHVTSLGIEAGGRLVEQHQFGLADERPGNAHAPLLAAGEWVDGVVLAFGQLDELEQLCGPCPRHVPRDVEVPGVDYEVLENRQFVVELVHLRDDPDAGPDGSAVGCGTQTEDLEPATGGRGHASDHAHARCLAGSVRAEEPECFALLDVEIDLVDCDEVAEFLHERSGGDEWFVHEVMLRVSRMKAAGCWSRDTATRVPLWTSSVAHDPNASRNAMAQNSSYRGPELGNAGSSSPVGVDE